MERCGVPVSKDKTVIYQLEEHNYGEQALSGTSEMALASFFKGRRLKNTPEFFTSASRCFRPEVAYGAGATGIYRVHEFTKVEMFAVVEADESEETLQRILKIQDQLFSDLGLAYQIIDMAPHELGAPAVRKYDIEAYFPSKESYGEISSCSNCTDYQSRRLDIRNENGEFLHTVNGTACAVPRMIMAICEQFQRKDGLVVIPEPLRRYMRKAEIIVPKPKAKRPKFNYISSPTTFVGKTIS